jgi:hypothetical protein
VLCDRIPPAAEHRMAEAMATGKLKPYAGIFIELLAAAREG